MNEKNEEWFKKLIYRRMIAERSILKQANISLELIAWTVQQVERAEELEKEIKSHAPDGRNYTNEQYVSLRLENKQFREALNSAVSEIKYALYSNKSREVKDHYLKNAERYIDEVLYENQKNRTSEDMRPKGK